MNLNIVQCIITMHIEEKMQFFVFKNVKRRREISITIIFYYDKVKKILFSISLVSYNIYIKKSNDNV